MIPLMEKELVERRQWLDRETFMDILSIAQAMPGVFAVNMATNIGYRLKGARGAVSAVVGNILVPILIILGFATCFHYLRGNETFEAIFKGVRPAVVALIAAPVFKMAKTAKLSWRNCWIPIVAVALICLLGVSPSWIVLTAIICGLLYGFLQSRKEEQQ